MSDPKTTTPSAVTSTAATQVGTKKSKPQELADQAKEAASKGAEHITAETEARAEGAKDKVAAEVSDVSSALRSAADEMRSGSPQERTCGQIAEGLADVSDAIQNKDLGTMVGDVNTFARKNPMVFLAGAAAIGFAASRFAKASRPATMTAPSQVSHRPTTHGEFS